MKIKPIIFILSALLSWNSFSQNFYDVDNIREIKLYFTQPNWDYLLDSLYLDGLEERLLASVEIDGSMYDSVGVRYKVFSSVSINTVKNPFNIKLDYIDNNQNHEGFEKIKLSNVIKDPSFLREVLSYEIARDYIPSPRANFANVYVNDSLWGLYVNVEAVTRERIKNYCSTSMLGSNKKEAIGYEIKVRNTKAVPIKIKIQDQIPTTGNSEISISVEEDSDGELNKDSGILTWEKNISASSTEKVEVKFEVKFPKEKFVNL